MCPLSHETLNMCLFVYVWGGFPVVMARGRASCAYSIALGWLAKRAEIVGARGQLTPSFRWRLSRCKAAGRAEPLQACRS